jgi:hypothetical protein
MHRLWELIGVISTVVATAASSATVLEDLRGKRFCYFTSWKELNYAADTSQGGCLCFHFFEGLSINRKQTVELTKRTVRPFSFVWQNDRLLWYD